MTKPEPGVALHRALASLWGAVTLPELLSVASSEVCRRFGADRAWVARNDGNALVVLAAHAKAPSEAEQMRRALVGRRLPLEPGSPESEAVRRHQALLDGDHAMLAPLSADGRLVGLLRAEMAADGPPLGTGHRDALWAYAEGLGFAAGRIALLERLHAQRRHVTEMALSAQAVVGELSSAPVDPLSSDTDTLAVVTGTAALAVAPGEARALLSRREREVVELLGSGATNAEIAKSLCVSPDTVKTHVRRILRKLRAANRAEAVSRYLH